MHDATRIRHGSGIMLFCSGPAVGLIVVSRVLEWSYLGAGKNSVNNNALED